MIHIDPNYPGSSAYKAFETWANQACRDGHLSPAQSQGMVSLFNQTVLNGRQSMSDFVRGLNEIGKLSDGNKMHASHRAAAIYGKWRQALEHRTFSIDCGKIQQIASRSGFIWFYKAPENSLTECFGNFYEIPGGIWVNNHPYRNAEAAFQAQKYPGREREFSNLDGESAFQQSQKLERSGMRLPDGWHQGVKDMAMRAVLAAKFAPKSALSQVLLNTGMAYLVEHNPKKGRDTYWSDDHDGSGRNRLGELLMERRHALGGAPAVARPKSYSDNPVGLH